MFLKQAFAVLGFAAACITPVATGAAVVPPQPYFRHSDYGALQLSPSGRYLGALVPVEGRLRLSVIDLDTRTARVAAAVRGEDIRAFDWVSDNRLVFTVFDLQAGLGEQRGGGLFAIDRDGANLRILDPTAKEKGWNRVYTAVHSIPRDGTDDIIVLNNENDLRYPGIFRMDTRTGRKTSLVDSRPGDVIHWVVDRKHQVRAAITSENKGLASAVHWRAAPGENWVKLTEFGHRDHGFHPVEFDGDGSLLVASNLDRDTFALQRYDAQARKPGEVIAAHPRADLYGDLVFDPRKNAIVGLRYDAERPGSAWLDDDWARLQQTIDAALPDRVNVISRPRSGSRALVYSHSDTDPGSYYLFDVDRRQLEFVAARRKGIDPKAMPAREPVRYTARDGLEIPGYLTLPKGRDAKNLPLVLYVHGGPWVRGGHWDWSAEAAWLAAKGYAVLEPDFRGSRGWGTKLFFAGWKQWGLAMQDDLVDGIDWLAKDGRVDPKRVCIMGASYGGYAVMMGLARDAGRFRCGINYVGVTDINLMFDVTWSDFARSDYIENSAKELIGDPDKDAAQFRATSPLEQAAKIKAPVLMAYGGGDRRVPLVHGEKMRSVLERQGTPVEWIVYPEEGHGFLTEAARFDFYERVGRFLDRHNPPD